MRRKNESRKRSLLAKTIESSPDYEIYIKTHTEEKENTNG